jgi:large subunit ribosomal protein L9
MQIILREDVHNLGKAGEVVTVKPGYGRNYLVPQGLASHATAHNIKQVEHHKKVIAAAQAVKAKESQALADKLGAVQITLERQAGEDDKLFGSVTTRDVEAALKEKGIAIDHKKLVIADPIKAIGDHNVEAKLGGGVSAHIKVSVTAKK